ncbi:uncharacterized protein LOC121969285 [Zingiber officinale]|uniref:Uncharacterized protein n=1 Tax=Zingiber officinale TaxID=94328 RepID=A0A8J5H6Q7_ZINOF|nr:uncharacterized protein LOC121969285 [Zingiber officinale]KAG6513219.1 hypothetical protein ZIOFF_023531 [Zingiber officinale]
MESARESRRRRILERGSDRLAFISGQARSVPGSTSASGDPHTSVGPLTEVHATNDHLSGQNGSNNDHKNASGMAELGGNSVRSNERPKAYKVLASDMTKNDDGATEPGRNDQVKTLQTERDTMTPNTSVFESSSQQVAYPTVSTMQVKKQMPFSSKQVSRGISASENKRLLCAVIIALLVIMSNRGYTLGGGVANSILIFRPLFLAILTDITIILWLLMTTQHKAEKEKEKVRTGRDESGSTNTVGDAVDALLAFQKAATAIFMDCSICAIIIICGLCF